MGKTKLPVGLPSPTPTQAYWQTPPHPIATHRTTPALPKTTTYAIVGSGVSGALIAYKLLEAQPTASITILEARTTCSGATGRNGGHCRAGRYLSFADDLATFGEDEALRMEKLEEDNVKLVGELIRSLRIDCDLRDVETLDVTTDEAQWEAVLKALEERKRVLSGKVAESVLTKHRIWSKEETRNELLIPEGVGAVSFPAFKLSPYKFVCGLLELCIARGLNLQTNTPVLEVSQLSTRRGEKWWQVHTDRGSISAKNVILATNAYTPFLYPPLSNFIIPTRGQVAAIRPGSNISGNPALQRTMGLNSAVADDYMQARSEGTTGAGDLIIGGGRNLGTHGEQPVLDDSTIHSTVSHYLTNACAGYFGKKNWGDNGEVLQEWTGIMGYTRDSQPVVGEAPGQKGLFISAGFNGHGMALTFEAAEALVQIILGNEEKVDEWLPKCYKLSRVPKLVR